MHRFLCLHGHSQNEHIFYEKTGGIRKALKEIIQDFVIVSAPHEIPLREGQEVSMNTWYYKDYDLNVVDVDSLKFTLDILQDLWNKQQFDGIIGFSQGGTLATIIASLCDEKYSFNGLKYLIIIGSPEINETVLTSRIIKLNNFSNCIKTKTIFIIGKSDEWVPNDSTLQLSNRFFNKVIIYHDGGHYVPSQRYILSQLKEHLEKYMCDDDTFSLSLPKEEAYSDNEIFQLQVDEISSLIAIYPDMVEVIRPIPQSIHDACPVIVIHFKYEENKEIILRVEYTCSYPSSGDVLWSLKTDGLSLADFSLVDRSAITKVIRSIISSNSGQCYIYNLIEGINDWITNVESRYDGIDEVDAVQEDDDLVLDAVPTNEILSSFQREVEGNEAEEVAESQRIKAAIEEAYKIASEFRDKGIALKDEHNQLQNISNASKGPWNMVVGLIGKPSVGKSAFFNASTKALFEKRKLAKVGAAPFTTILPNIGLGYFASYDNDASNTNGITRESEYGRDKNGRRFLPVLVKDVAGLVQGSYKGRGKGNRFLNDLTDADVLIHVLDISGKSDVDGNIIECEVGNPRNAESDYYWIRTEVHRWIVGNIKSKWNSVCRKNIKNVANRVHELFSGYKNPHLIGYAASRAKLDLKEAAQWTCLDLHRLVAHYITVRFPLCLALNKLDQVDGVEAIARMQNIAVSRGEVAVPCSAKYDNYLIYEEAKANGLLVADPEYEVLRSDCERFSAKFASLKHGVIEVLSEAIRLKNPLFVYPVNDVETEQPLDLSANPMKHCLLFKSNSTVGSVYDALKHRVITNIQVNGDFVKAEGRGLNGDSKRRLMGKETPIDDTNNVLKIYTNRKTTIDREDTTAE
jgi:ribosome-binding ATPase YchF (GTP1/OBG family)